MFILRQSTAVDVLIGPFVDGTDGATPEEALSPSVQLSKNGQGAGTKNEGTTPAHDNAGYYNCVFDATDTGTVGTLVAFVEGATGTFLQVRHEFQIMDTAAFDALFADGAEGPLQATTVGRTLDIVATGEVALDFGSTIGTLDAAQFGADFITSAKIADNALANEHFADGALTATEVTSVGSAASVTAGVTLAAGAVTDVSLAGGLEIVFETDFGTNYNTGTNAWETNLTDTIGTLDAADFGADFITSAKIADGAFLAVNFAASSLNGKGDWNINKTGYTLTATTGLGAQTANITGNLSGSVGSVTGSIGSNLELGPTEVNAQVVDVLFTDTDAEPGKGLPGATISLADKIGFLYKAWRNRSTQTATVYSLYNDDGSTVDHDATVSDDTTTADRGEMTDGP